MGDSGAFEVNLVHVSTGKHMVVTAREEMTVRDLKIGIMRAHDIPLNCMVRACVCVCVNVNV